MKTFVTDLAAKPSPEGQLSGFRHWLFVRQEALRYALAREAHLASILDTVPDAMIVIDEGGIVQSFSPAAERLFGYSAADMIGKNVKMLMPSPYRESHDGYI